MELDERVKEVLAKAKFNGRTFEGWAPGQIANNLIQVTPEFEEVDFCELCETIHAVRLGYQTDT